MATLFMLIIYIAFISLGLPDTLLGSAWPVMQVEFGVPLDAEGVITLIVCLATIFSCLVNGWLVQKLGTGKIAALSGVLTAVALLGYSQAPSFGWMLLFSVPLGLGAGSVDTCLNNYGALFLSARQVNWQHCCYGLGAAAGPLILSIVLGQDANWRYGYLTIAIIQLVIAAILFLSLPMWKGRDYKGEKKSSDTEEGIDIGTNPNAVRQCNHTKTEHTPLLLIPGVLVALISYAVFFGIEYGAALWAPSYLVGARAMEPEFAARIISFYYLCLMVGRFVSGVLAAKFSDKALIRLGGALCIIGTILLGMRLPFNAYYLAMAVIGFGCAPIFPCMIHLTPNRFGRENSQRVMGVQMAAAYMGTAFITPCIGLVADGVGVGTIPWFILGLSIAIICLSEYVDHIVAKKK